MRLYEIPEELEYIRYQLLSVAKFDEDLDIDEVDINGVCGGGWYYTFTPLTWAAAERNLPLVQWLVSQGADIDVQDGGSHNNGYTPLMSAAMRGYDDVVEYLLTNGANPRIERIYDSKYKEKEKENAYKISIRCKPGIFSFWSKAQEKLGYANFDRTQELLKNAQQSTEDLNDRQTGSYTKVYS